MNIRLEKAKHIIKENYSKGSLGLYDTRNLCGDLMTRIYEDNEIIIDVCRYYEYFEVIGLTDKEFSELEEYYERLQEMRK